MIDKIHHISTLQRASLYQPTVLKASAKARSQRPSGGYPGFLLLLGKKMESRKTFRRFVGWGKMLAPSVVTAQALVFGWNQDTTGWAASSSEVLPRRTGKRMKFL
jgi:hypothetical protein